MRKKVTFIIFILIFTLAFTGCGKSTDKGDKGTDNNIQKEKEGTDKAKGEDTKEDDIKEDDIKDVFSNIKDIDEYHYEMELSGEDIILSSMKMWVSKNKMRMETYSSETQENIIMIVDNSEEVAYFYDPKAKTAIKMKYDDSSVNTEETKLEGAENYIDTIKEVAGKDNVEVKNGDLNGEAVKIITSKIEGETSKIWISNKTGFPLKIEAYEDDKLISTVLIKNFEKKAIDPSMFTIPEGTEIMDMTKLLDEMSK